MIRSLSLFGVLALAACSGGPAGTDGSGGNGGSCSANDQCDSGEICRSGECERLCDSDSQCTGELVCSDSICQPGERATPRISTVRGDSNIPCPAPGAGNCIIAGMLVEGENLEGADVVIAAATTGLTTQLIKRPGSSDTQLEVDLPIDIAPGFYTLVATNSVGTATQDLELLQGPPGPAMTGDELVTVINGASSTLSAGVLPVGSGSSDVAAGNHLHSYGEITGVHTHDYSDITSSHDHPFAEITGTADISQLPTGTAATEVALGDHTHQGGSCYHHWGAASCAAPYTAVLTGRTGGLENYNTGGAAAADVQCVSDAATVQQSWASGYNNRLMRADSDGNGMQKVNGACAICCTGGCYTAFGTNNCAAGYTRVYEGRVGGVEGYTGPAIHGKTMCVDLGATARETWASGYSTRLMRHRATTGTGPVGMDKVTNSCAVCCQ